MSSNWLNNRLATRIIAESLKPVDFPVVFVGGAMVGLYIDDDTAEDIRPTKDIDLSFEIASVAKLEQLREALINVGFQQTAEDSVICRFRFKDIKVDVMSTQQVGWAPSNSWFADGFAKSISYDLDGLMIQILPVSYFVASKLEALFNRGMKDIYASHDLEDIVYLFNYTTEIVDEISKADSKVRKYIAKSLQKILSDKGVMSALEGCLNYKQAEEQMEIICDRFEQIIDSRTLK